MQLTKEQKKAQKDGHKARKDGKNAFSYPPNYPESLKDYWIEGYYYGPEGNGIL